MFQEESTNSDDSEQSASESFVEPLTPWSLNSVIVPRDSEQVAFAEDYSYAEIGIGPQFRRCRGHVYPIRNLPFPDSAKVPETDYGMSCRRFSAQLAEFAESNPSPTSGKTPSVAGYAGPTWTDRVRIDVDAPTIAQALRYAKMILDLLARLGIPRIALSIAFSGSKGFHLELSAGWFGWFHPSANLHTREKQLVRLLLAGLGNVFDAKVYDRTRIWRVRNSRNTKSDLYKFPLTPDEVLNLDIELLRSLARAPRYLDLPLVLPIPIPALVTLWQSTASPEPGQQQRAPRSNAAKATAAARRPPPVRGIYGDLDAVLKGVAEGNRNDALFRYACRLRAQDCTQSEAEALILSAAGACTPPYPEDEALAIIANVWARYFPGRSDDVADRERVVARKGVITLG